jgi:hypothetical protein
VRQAATRRALAHLRRLLDALEAMDDATREAFLRGAPAPGAAPRPAPPGTGMAVEAVHGALLQARDRAAAQAVLAPLKGPQLTALMARMALRSPSRATVQQKRDIIANAIGTGQDIGTLL